MTDRTDNTESQPIPDAPPAPTAVIVTAGGSATVEADDRRTGMALNISYVGVARDDADSTDGRYAEQLDPSQRELVDEWFRDLPALLGDLTAIATLNLWNCRLGDVPEWLGDLVNLTTINFWNSRADSLPEALGNLTKLTVFNLWDSRVNRLPESLGNLSALTDLNAWNNCLGDLPESLGDLTGLTTLTLNENGLEHLPESLGNLTNLTTLEIARNRLASLPEWLGNLTNLTALDISGNDLHTLPRSLGKLRNLTTLSVADNPLPLEIRAAAREGTDELIGFLHLIEAEGIEIAEAKLVLVGEGEVGKSSLLAAMRGDPWVERRSQTHGMEILPLTIKDRQGAPIVLNGWDFGGQQIYRPTHQLFFTTPAIYLVVWKPRQGPEAGMVERWLKTIEYRAGLDARVHVVATHGGLRDRSAQLDELGLRERFGDLIAGFHVVDSDPAAGSDGLGHGLAELKVAIAETAAALPHTRRWYPESWQRARALISARTEQSLTYGEYENIVRDAGLSPTAARSLAMNAHVVGTWIHYGDEPSLSEVVIVKPDWLNVAIARVLDNRSVGDVDGLVTHRRLGEIWSTSAGPRGERYSHVQQQVFLRLMERFELTYRVPEQPGAEPESLVAQLVPAAAPDLGAVWKDVRPDSTEAVQVCQIIERKTQQTATRPELVYRLIVRFHQPLSAGAKRQVLHWQRGLVATSRYGAKALIELTADGVRVTVRGPDPYVFLRQVTDEIRNCVDNFFPGLETAALVVCGEPCPTPGRGQFSIDKLIQLQDNGIPKTACPNRDCATLPDVGALLGTSAPSSVSEAITSSTERVISVLNRRFDLADARNAELSAGVLRHIDAVSDEQKQLLARCDAHIRMIQQNLADEAANGPRLFTLTPIEASAFHPAWTKRRMRLTLYCEHSRWPVHAIDHDKPDAGVYTVEITRDWWKKAAPLLTLTAAVIKPFLGVGFAGTELGLDESEWKSVEKQLGLAKEAVASAVEIAGKADIAGGGTTTLVQHEHILQASGGMLRTFHALLADQDVTFADLRRVSDNQNRYIWVHPRFLPIYQPPLPEIPR